jgi:GT2 family glycosyltransferase
MAKLPVIAAIPNYNMASELKRLLPQLLKQGYSAIYVLDDASTDNSREVVKAFGSKVRFVEGGKNKGAGATRNRILEVIKEECIIHFLDADIIPETENMATAVQKIVPSEDFGFIGGLTLGPNGMQNVWNYGPKSSPRNEIGAHIQAKLEKLIAQDPARARRVRKRYKKLLLDWPDPLSKPVKKEVYWCIEQNLIFNSNIFRKLGGFDESIRETEISDLAIRSHQIGLKSYFDPNIVTRHTEAKVRNYNRNLRKAREMYKINFKYGLLNWLLGKS